MRRKTKLTVLVMILSLALGSVSAQELDLKANKNVFEPGEVINITAEVSNPSQNALRLTSLLSSQGGDISPRPQTFIVNKSEEKEIIIYSLEVEDSFPDGNYTILAFFHENKNLGSIQSPLAKDKVDLKVVNTKQDFNFSLKICGDYGCNLSKKTFSKGEIAYLDYASDVSDLEINSSIENPNGSTTEVNLPFSLETKQEGVYKLKANVSKSGYLKKTKSHQFGVVERDFELDDSGNCFSDGTCEPEWGENYKTCPQDCSSSGKDNYCDGLEDGRCDPDCEVEKDPDCEKSSSIFFSPYFLIPVSIIILLILFTFLSSRKLGKKVKRA